MNPYRVAAGLLACWIAFNAFPVHAGDEVSKARVGEKIPNLKFVDDKGKTHQLHDLKNQKAIVLVFLAFECPVSNSYSQPLAELARDYAKRGVTVWGLTPNQEDGPAEVAKHAKEFNLPFPVFRDDKYRAAQALQADITPEAFVLDSSYVLRYRGRIDDSYTERLQKKHDKVGSHDLSLAVAELVAGRPTGVTATKAIGCPITREEKVVAKVGSVTYHRDVQPIVQNHCQSCHRPGESGPFALTNYRQAVNWADDIKSYTQNRTMPPWKPSEGIAFHNERRLSDKDIATLAAWVDGGTPKGDEKDAPAKVTFPEGWKLGTPDLVLTVDNDFLLGPNGKDVFRCFVLPTSLKEDQYVSALEVRPGNNRVVHHALLFVDKNGKGRELADAWQAKQKPVDPNDADSAFDRGPGYNVTMGGVGFAPTGGLSGWAPGQMPRHQPDGVGWFLPKQSDVVMQLHYHRNGRAEKDRTQVGLYFAKKKIDHPLVSGVIGGGVGKGPFRMFFSIPAGESQYPVDGDLWATGDFTLLSVMPHMHMVGKQIEVAMTPPGGKPQKLMTIKDWDYNWQETYFFKQPIQVKAGTRFHVDAVYDNSLKNPRNPFNPPRRITFGEQTDNEMCFVFLGGYAQNNTLRKLPLTQNQPANNAAAGGGQ